MSRESHTGRTDVLVLFLIFFKTLNTEESCMLGKKYPLMNVSLYFKRYVRKSGTSASRRDKITNTEMAPPTHNSHGIQQHM